MNEAICYFKMAIEKGKTYAKFYYANLLYEGTKIERNVEETAYYFKMVVKQNDAKSMNKYGLMLLKGESVEANMTKTVKYFKMSADNGDIDGCKIFLSFVESGKVECDKETIQKYKQVI